MGSEAGMAGLWLNWIGMRKGDRVLLAGGKHLIRHGKLSRPRPCHLGKCALQLPEAVF